MDNAFFNCVDHRGGDVLDDILFHLTGRTETGDPSGQELSVLMLELSLFLLEKLLNVEFSCRRPR